MSIGQINVKTNKSPRKKTTLTVNGFACIDGSSGLLVVHQAIGFGKGKKTYWTLTHANTGLSLGTYWSKAIAIHAGELVWERCPQACIPNNKADTAKAFPRDVVLTIKAMQDWKQIPKEIDTVEQWSNKLGWNISRHGMVGSLSCRDDFWTIAIDIAYDKRKMMYVYPGIDPRKAFDLCEEHGIERESWDHDNTAYPFQRRADDEMPSIEVLAYFRGPESLIPACATRRTSFEREWHLIQFPGRHLNSVRDECGEMLEIYGHESFR